MRNDTDKQIRYRQEDGKPTPHTVLKGPSECDVMTRSTAGGPEEMNKQLDKRTQWEENRKDRRKQDERQATPDTDRKMRNDTNREIKKTTTTTQTVLQDGITYRQEDGITCRQEDGITY